MELTAAKKEALARLAGHAGQLRWAMELDKADGRAGEGGGRVSDAVTSRGRVEHFEAALDAFRRDFYDSDLMDRNYSQTIETLGGGRSGHDLAEQPSDCGLPLTLAVLTFLMRAERFVWGFWDEGKNRGKLVRVLFHLRGLADGRPAV